jgi:putative DNA methylase
MPDPKQPPTPDGWHSRGYLPHFDGGEIPQFITFRLADSMPQALLDRWRSNLATEQNIDIDAALRKRIELYLDQGYGKCCLKNPTIAESVQNSLLFYGDRYRLTAWVIMPNHVHMLMTPCAGEELSRILQSLKSYTANEANKRAGRDGQFWQPESFDRYVRDADHFAKVIAYIENNPVKARLCKRPEDWRFSSAWFRKRRVK